MMKALRLASLVVAACSTACGTVAAPIVDAQPPDGSLVDASNSDANHTPDAALPPDGFVPTHPPVTNGQSADLVLGQADFTSSAAYAGMQESLSVFNGPTGILAFGEHLWIGDNSDARVLQWNSIPLVNKQTANFAIGQASGTAHTGGTTAAAMDVGPHKIASDGAHLVVSDPSNNRVLIWSSIPTASGVAANLVIGQTSLTAKASGNGPDQLSGPEGVWTDGTRLIVADKFNSRVLIWNTFPTTNGQPADVVVGRAAFFVGGETPPANPPTGSSLTRPRGVTSDGVRLFVVDGENNRIMVWNGIPTTNGAAADYVIGQGAPDLGGPDASGASVNAIGLHSPTAVVVAYDSVFICDGFNHRVVVHTPTPTTSGTAATAVLGASDLTTLPLTTGATQDHMNSCDGLTVAGGNLFVVDNFWNRVLRFHLSP